MMNYTLKISKPSGNEPAKASVGIGIIRKNCDIKVNPGKSVVVSINGYSLEVDKDNAQTIIDIINGK